MSCNREFTFTDLLGAQGGAISVFDVYAFPFRTSGLTKFAQNSLQEVTSAVAGPVK
jgi:hypothetical protein